MENLASNFEAFGAFQKDVHQSINAINTVVNGNSTMIRSGNDRAATIQSSLDAVIAKISTLSPKSEIRTIAKQLEAHEKQMTLFTEIAVVANVSDKL